MTIRKILLIAFLLVSLVPAVMLAWLTFFAAGGAMREEIGRSLVVQSATVSSDIDKMLFERLQNALTWRRLDVMQEIQVNDVDKRLALFLAELKVGYRDVYNGLSCVDSTGRVVASSDPSAIGTILPQRDTMLMASENIALETLRLDKDKATLTIRADVPSQFKHGNAGQILLDFNWAQIYGILDQAAQNGRMVILVDNQNRIIAASDALRKQGMLLTELPREWLPPGKSSGTATLDGTPFHLTEVIAGYDRSHGFQHFPGFSWTTLVVQPSRQAFIPVRHMALIFAALLAATSLSAVGLSLLVAARIARPITALTAFTRRFMQEKALSPTPDHAGGEVGELTAAFVQTVHDLEQSRQDLIRASKLAVVGEMAAVMAHEVRTPLGILSSSAQMLAREPGLSQEARELTGFIESETQRLNNLVSTLLGSTRMRPPAFRPQDMQFLIHHAVEILGAQAEKKGIFLSEHTETPIPPISCDAEQITQVLLNLILNALQILPENGHIEIRCEVRGDLLLIHIADDGPGILPEDRSRVFDPFFTRREGGVGLGLAVVQQIVAAHGGNIKAGASNMGGALFTIALPLKETS